MYSILQVFCSIFSGTALAAAIPNEFASFGSPETALLALAPLYIAIQKSASRKEAFLLCSLHGLTTHVLSSFWLGNFYGYAAFTLGASAIGTGLLEGLASLFFSYPASITRTRGIPESMELFPNASAFRAMWFALCYTAWEWVKSTGFLAYPWGTLSMTAYRWPLIMQIADITGAYGVTFLFALFNATAAEGAMLIAKRGLPHARKAALASFKNAASFCLALFLAAALYGAHERTKPRKQTKTLNAVLVQPSKDPWARGEEEEALSISMRLSEEKIGELKKRGLQCDLVVWSEAMLTRRFPSAKTFYTYFPEPESVFDFIARMRVPFIVGAPVTLNAELNQHGNSTLLIDKSGNVLGSYQKMHLVPFAELVPGSKYKAVQKLMKKMIGFTYGWTPGRRPVLFDIPLSRPETDWDDWKKIHADGREFFAPKTPSVLISTPICFDDSAAEVCRALYLAGSEVFMNITNDSWSKTKSAEIQHFVVSSYRAIEYRTTLARCANSGCTVVVGPTGKILADIPLFEQNALAAEIPVFKREMTFYARFGNWLPMLAVIAIFSFVALSEKRQRSGE